MVLWSTTSPLVVVLWSATSPLVVVLWSATSPLVAKKMIIIFFLITTQALDTFSPENILRFADHLYLKEDYNAALNEYRRYQFLADSIRSDVPEKIIDCLVNLEKYQEALIESDNIADESKRKLIRGTIFFNAQQYDSSRSCLSDIDGPFSTDAEKIIGFSYVFEFRFREADKYLTLPSDRPKYKKPGLGALCALIPGGGHWYCGRFGDGMFSFFLVGTSALLAYYYRHENEDIKYGICLGATGLLYAANIYGGINAVHNYNYYQNKAYLQRILEQGE